MTAIRSSPSSDPAALVRAHQRGVWRYLRFLGCDPPRADDLTQETFLAVLRRPFDASDPARSAAYLRTVARHLFLKQIRSNHRILTFQDLEETEQAWTSLSPGGSGDDYLDALRACLQSLQGQARQALEMQYRERASRAGIASALSMTEDGVKSLVRRARDRLRRCIEKRIAP